MIQEERIQKNLDKSQQVISDIENLISLDGGIENIESMSARVAIMGVIKKEKINIKKYKRELKNS